MARLPRGLKPFVNKMSRISLKLKQLDIVEQVKRAMVADNRRGILGRKDRWDRPMDKVTRYRGRVGTGPPTAPRYSKSRIVSDYTVVSHKTGKGVTFIGLWPTFNTIIGYLRKRWDILGIRREGIRRINEILDRYSNKFFK